MAGVLPERWELGLTGCIDAVAVPLPRLKEPEESHLLPRGWSSKFGAPQEAVQWRHAILSAAALLEDGRLPTAYNVGILIPAKMHECRLRLKAYAGIGLVQKGFREVHPPDAAGQFTNAQRILARKSDFGRECIIYSLTDEGRAVLQVLDAQYGPVDSQW